ncbi:glycosyltransferase [Thalassoglobus sp. JC818]|uniref:glycosyltransferase n=1 Tax=Thalassoglobus sp. JC818 TaxID=3232136 RepID=UPI003457AC08
MRIAQVCNVGEICGGTAACAWSITLAFPDVDHTVIFLSPPNSRTVEAFQHCQFHSAKSITDGMIRHLNVDLVILHNSTPNRVAQIRSTPSIQYHHSMGSRTAADVHLACSKWLHQRTPQSTQVLWQPTPIPIQRTDNPSRNAATSLRIGRICTPDDRKWPQSLIPLYERLAESFKNVEWEFIGAPGTLRESLQHACRGNARFITADVSARSRYWSWHALLYHHPTISESFGRTVAESMRCGTVPIVDRKGGFCEQIESGKNGFLCTNPDDFVAAIHQIQDRNHLSQLSQRAQDSSHEKCSLSIFRSRFLRILNQLSLGDSFDA